MIVLTEKYTVNFRTWVRRFIVGDTAVHEMEDVSFASKWGSTVKSKEYRPEIGFALGKQIGPWIDIHLTVSHLLLAERCYLVGASLSASNTSFICSRSVGPENQGVNYNHLLVVFFVGP